MSTREATQDTNAFADGSSPADAHPRVQVDRRTEPYRWVCPNGHVNWDRTNNHIWCQTCRRQYEAGDDVDPEHYHIVDRKANRRVPWSAVDVVETE